MPILMEEGASQKYKEIEQQQQNEGQSQRFEDATLVALKMKGGTKSQGMHLRCQKMQENGISPRGHKDITVLMIP